MTAATDWSGQPLRLSLHGLLLRLSHSLLELSSQMGHDPNHSLDQHDLPAVMHFVLFHGQNHLESALRCRRRARRHVDRLREKLLGSTFNKLCPCLANFFQECNHLGFCARLGLLCHEFGKQHWKIETIKVRALLNRMKPKLKPMPKRDMRQHLLY